jgi:hypothetical protein
MCNHDIEETLHHLFFECEFTQTALHQIWDLSLSMVELIEDGKRHFTHSCFMEVTMIASWAIWIHHNNLIFNNVPISFARWKMEFSELLFVCKFRAKPILANDIDDWLASL